MHSCSPDVIYIRLEQLLLPSSMCCQHKRDNSSHRTQPSREPVPTFSTLCNNIGHFSLTLRSRINLLNLFNYLFGDGFIRLTRLKWKLIISNIAIFGFATPSRRHSPKDSNGYIQGQENIKALTIMPVRCQPELTS